MDPQGLAQGQARAYHAFASLASISFRSAMTHESRDAGLHRRENLAALAARPPHLRPAQRLCIHCRQPFASAHAGHRICTLCRDKLIAAGVMALPD